ncbi:MAG: hypothetical protein S0880_13205 [Actinomycetota bacterium]|nr:hypothetical protein [Actinomycetota bacterium]
MSTAAAAVTLFDAAAGNDAAAIPGHTAYALRTSPSGWQVVNRRTGRTLSGWVQPDGRREYRLVDDAGIRVTRSLAALVLTVFDRPRRPGEFALHANDDASDDRLANLRWGTPADNGLDRANNGRIRGRALTEADVAEIKRRVAFGERHADIAADFGVIRQSVSHIATRHRHAEVKSAPIVVTLMTAEAVTGAGELEVA